ncbi:MAG: Formamidopyrimidine-DNA glycosylase [Alphaproteobacteria bacterium MarineAlpha5_Bin11]|nr:DNA-formamidopyrimidine glycosylase [Pelagibacteraceae bacterium]PPR45164.1 MAG: Formamidopyrimidine-DNA glycosylase [Alphaproteobacteria bacterium MarineAlpha5_Bin11]PPR52136.1 MAG: Formamidopyrimidine-DNA glycosylase [Alphaproteobacteria bacterium MarineAlpha5_Bin10]|tara:strand:- start:112 stop:942 length:831 start_codon:yes stop_codon:yes gene_type:complete
MPELPEVETTTRGLQYFVGFYIKIIKIHKYNLRYPIPRKIPIIVKNSKIQSIQRVAKYIIINLNNSHSLIFHLGMSGRLKKTKNRGNISKEKHDHIEILFKNGEKIAYNDPRRFGMLDYCVTKNLYNHKFLKNLGLDPFDRNFDAPYLLSRIKKSNSSIKSLIINQKIIAGIGNIYASEILFDCGISPFRKGNKILKREIPNLINSIKKILKKAIKSKGSTLKDYVSVEGNIGNFQNSFVVYNNDGKTILFGSVKAKIVKKTQNGRSTFYCPYYQK